jgi:tetratricopeptide (TPR) repeat protein
LKGLEFLGEWIMDWLDKLSITAIAGLTLIIVGMLVNHEITETPHRNPGPAAKEQKDSYTLQMEIDKEIYQGVISYKEKGLYAEAMAELRDVIGRYPENPRSYVYMAQLYLEQGKLGDAIHNYRQAVEMEPDYVDERTPLFIGDKIKGPVTEGREKFAREKALKPKDKRVKMALKDVYFLQSRLAGGCE